MPRGLGRRWRCWWRFGRLLLVVGGRRRGRGYQAGQRPALLSQYQRELVQIDRHRARERDVAEILGVAQQPTQNL